MNSGWHKQKSHFLWTHFSFYHLKFQSCKKMYMACKRNRKNGKSPTLVCVASRKNAQQKHLQAMKADIIPSWTLWHKARDIYEPIWFLDLSRLAVKTSDVICNKRNGPIHWVHAVFLEVKCTGTISSEPSCVKGIFSSRPVHFILTKDIKHSCCVRSN